MTRVIVIGLYTTSGLVRFTSGYLDRNRNLEIGNQFTRFLVDPEITPDIRG